MLHVFVIFLLHGFAGFSLEATNVKAQILNLAVKMFLSNPLQCGTLFKYVMDLCKYDTSYDLRDKARLMRSVFFIKKSATGVGAGADGVAADNVEATSANGETGTDQIREGFKQSYLSVKPAAFIESSEVKLSYHCI